MGGARRCISARTRDNIFVLVLFLSFVEVKPTALFVNFTLQINHAVPFLSSGGGSDYSYRAEIDRVTSVCQQKR